MDPRHETFKEEVLNHIIQVINAYIKLHIDDMVTNGASGPIKRICERIYGYVGMQVEVSAVLSKRNLLSIDVVYFPLIADSEADKILKDRDFAELMTEIQGILAENNQNSLMARLQNILMK